MTRIFRKHITAAFTAALTFTSAFVSAAASDSLALDGQWRFKLVATAEEGNQLGTFFAVDADLSGFAEIPVPSNWSVQGFEEPMYIHATTSEGLYVKEFRIPPDAHRQRTVLHFGGVWQSAEVWLNGQKLGRHDSGFTAFSFDVTSVVKPGAENRLAVRVRQQDRFWTMDQNDDWSLPGIYRGVVIEFLPKPFNLDRIEIVTDFDQDFQAAELKVRTLVARYEAGHPWLSVSEPVVVVAVLRDKNGQEVQRAQSEVRLTGARTSRDVLQVLRIQSPSPWTAETPNLYDLQVDLVVSGKTVHSRKERVGFREIGWTGGVLRLNGRPIKLRGVCRHDLHPEAGRATRREHWLADIRAMKAANINCVRTAHYPPAEGFLKLCDEFGLYVLNEIPFGLADELLADPSVVGEALTRVHETVRRDRNRPSVIVWCLGNEDPLTELHLVCARALKGIDPTRPLLLPWRAEADLPPEIDLLAPHYWTAEQYDRLAAAATRPIISTEYTHAVGAHDFGGLADRWNALVKHPSGAGAMIWEWADQGLRRKVKGRPVLDALRDLAKYPPRGNELVLSKRLGQDDILDVHGVYGGDGIVDGDLAPQRDYWETRAVYSPVQVLVDQLPLHVDQTEISVPVKNQYDFTDLSTVQVSWTLFQNQEEVGKGDATVTAPAHTVGALVVPIHDLQRSQSAGEAYLHLQFKDASGMELTRTSIRLGQSLASRNPAASGLKPTVRRSHDQILITTTKANYAFNANTGHLSSVEWSGEDVFSGMDIALWRTPTEAEVRSYHGRKEQLPWRTFLQEMPAKATKLDVSEVSEGIRVSTTTRYQAEGQNSVEVDYRFLVKRDEGLEIEYTVRPLIAHLEALPEIGIEFRGAKTLRAVSWLGLGPGDSLPNRRSSAMFGYWNLELDDSPDSLQPRSGTEYIDLHLGRDRVARIVGATGFRVMPSIDGAKRIRALSHQAGAWVKGALPERRDWRLDLSAGRTFKGQLELRPPNN